MIEIVPTVRDNDLAVKAVGRVTGENYQECIAAAVRFFALFMPCPVKIFHTREMSSTQQWINE